MVRTWRGRVGGWRRIPLVLAGLGLASAFSCLIPLYLPESPVPTRVLGRPHEILVGVDIDTSALVDRLKRLGYRAVGSGALQPGEYRLDGDRILLRRRGFVTPEGQTPEALLEIQLAYDRRVEFIRDDQGRSLESALLEPELIGSFDNAEYVDRTPISLDEVPAHLMNAVLMVEDRRFFEHGGLDLRRIVGATLANVRAGSIRQGGSTLTQQLAKNLFLSHERTLSRKLHEAWLALRLERVHSKREILEAYLNTIYLGQRGPYSVQGVDAAARHYFGKWARDLSLADSALLVGMISSPGLYSPFAQPARALKRRNQVLQILQETERITDEQYRVTSGLPLGTLAKPVESVAAPYFLAKLRRDLARDLPDLDPENQAVHIYTGLDLQLQLHAERAVARGLERLEADFPALTRATKRMQAALIAVDAETGAILAHVGGRDWAESQFDRATQAQRQPGSLFKPVVALAGLARGPDGTPRFTLASVLSDEPLSVDTPTGIWQPANHGGDFRGSVTLRRAIEDSINVPIARLGLAIGAEEIVRTARRMGIESPLNAVPSLALGTSEVSPLEMAAAYALLASGGARVEPRSYSSVTDRAGAVVGDRPVVKTREFDPAEVAIVTSALQGVVDRGTGRTLRDLGYVGALAGKTGTTNDSRDAWFVGYTPEIVAAVWVGFDDGTSLGLTGSSAALPIFADFVIASLGREGGADFEHPSGLETVTINDASGLRAGLFCWGSPELFLTGTAPQERCGLGWSEGAPEAGDDVRAQKQDRRRTRHDSGRSFFDKLRDLVDDLTPGG